jgi:hypothetical protein
VSNVSHTIRLTSLLELLYENVTLALFTLYVVSNSILFLELI